MQHISKTLLLLSLCTIILASSCSSPSSPLSTNSGSHLKIAIQEDPNTLDPRLARSVPVTTVMRMFYEGLMRTNAQGTPELAIAEKVTLSEDQRTYTFTLKHTTWSDGTPLTAHDFAQTWKSSLAPDFPAPNAYQLFLIKGAREAKEGRIPLNDIGIAVTDPYTLVVELEQPAPYFLEMTACHFYFPVSPQMRKKESNQSSNDVSNFIGNGPFKPQSWKLRNELTAIKNPSYWDADVVQLDKISLQVLDENTSLQLYKSGGIDWVGSPLWTLPQDAVSTLKQQGVLKVAPGAGTHWFRFNTKRAPFDNEKIRRAFAIALNRQDIVDHITQGNQTPAIGIVPPSMGFPRQTYFADHDEANANKLLNEALSELNITKDKLPPLSFLYAASDRNHKVAQAVQQQWKKTLGVDVALESCESKVLFDKMGSGTFQLYLSSWYADYNDPTNFLDIFKSKENPTNQTYWEDPRYAALLSDSSKESNPEKRLQTLIDAEMLLITAMPVAPLFHGSYNYLKRDNVEGVYFSPLGYLDFKNAYMKR